MDDQFIKGLREAGRVMRKDPGSAGYWLDRARRGRRRLWTILFNRGKYRFLGGFIAGLEWERAQLGADADPPEEPDAAAPSPAEVAGS